MAISHVFTNPIPDGTNTNIVRPSDWNSAHNQYYTLSGNTLGVSTVSGTNVVLQGGGNISLSGTGRTIVVYGTTTSSGGVALSAGSQSVSTGTVSFANSNGISFGMSGSNQITASYTVPTSYVSNVNGSSGQISIAAGSSLSSSTAGSSITFGLASNITTALQSAGNYLTTARASTDGVGLNTAQTNVTWTVNSSGISLNAAGYAGTNLSTANVSATLNSSGLTLSAPAVSALSNGNNITISNTGTNVGISAQAVAVGAGTQTATSGTLNFVNSNGVTFGMSGSNQITASVAGGGGGAMYANLSGATSGNTTASGNTLNFSGINVTLSGTNASQIAISAPATSSLSAGNNISLSSNGSTIGLSALAVGLNTAQTNVTWTVNSSGISLNAAGYAGTGTSATNASVTLNSAGLAISVAPPGAGVVYANLSGNTTGNTTASGSTLNFSGINITLSGTNNSQIAISAPAASGLSNGNNIAISSTGSTIGISAQAAALGAGTQTATSGTVNFVNSNGVTFGMSGSNQITASVAAGGAGNFNLSGATSGNTTATGNTINLSGINITLSGTNNSQIAISAPATSGLSAGNNMSITSNGSTIGFSALALGLNTAGTNITWTANSSGLSINAAGYAGTGFTSTTTAGTAVQGTLGTNGLNLAIPAYVTNASGGGGGVALSAGTQSVSTGTVNFANSNGISFGMSGSNQITASYTVPTVPTSYVSNVNGSSGQISLNVGSSLSSSTNGSSITFGLASNITTALQSAGAYLTTAAQSSASNLSIAVAATNNTGGGTATLASSISFTNANGLTFYTSAGNAIAASYTVPTQSVQTQASGAIAGTGFTSTTTAGTAVVGTLATNGLSLGVPAYLTAAAGGAGNFNLSGATSGNTTASGNTINLSGINITLSGTNNSQIAISAPATSSLVAGNNISISTNGSSINFSALAVAVGAGTQTATSGTLVFSNSNGITFGMSGNTRITASYTQSNQAFSASGGSSTFQTLNFANSNGVTFSNTGGSVVASYTVPATTGFAGTGFTSTTTAGTAVQGTLDTSGLSLAIPAYLTNAAGGGLTNINLSAGTTSNNLSNIVFNDANNVSFGLNGSTVTASIATSLTNVNVSAGTTSNNLSNVVFSNANGVSFGLNGSTVTASVAPAGGVIASGYSPHGDYPLVVGAVGQGTLALDPDIFPDLTLNQVAIPINFSAATNSTGSFTISNWIGLYSRSNSSLSRAHSTSFTAAITFSGTANSASYHGWRNLTYPWSTSVSGGRYWIAQIVSTTTGGANCSFSQYLASQVNTNFSGAFGVATNATAQFTLGQGFYSAATGALPVSMAFTQIQGTNSLAQRFPIVQFGFNTV